VLGTAGFTLPVRLTSVMNPAVLSQLTFKTVSSLNWARHLLLFHLIVKHLPMGMGHSRFHRLSRSMQVLNKAYYNHVIPQMADVRCSLCGEREVAVKDIIHVGFGDRYQVNAIHIFAR
jgi:hypothetical protein